jgi:hypothetical protein
VLRIGIDDNDMYESPSGDPNGLVLHSTVGAPFTQWSHGTGGRLAALVWTGTNWVVSGYATPGSLEPSIFYAVGASTTWNESTMPSLTLHAGSTCPSLVVVGGTGANLMAFPAGSGISDDAFISANHGATFTASTSTPDKKYEHVVWSSVLGVMVAHDTSDELHLSADGVTWRATGLILARINVTSDGYIIGIGPEADSIGGASSGMHPVYVIRELSAETSSELLPFIVYAGDVPFWPNTEELLLGNGAHTYVDDDGNQYLARWW